MNGVTMAFAEFVVVAGLCGGANLPAARELLATVEVKPQQRHELHFGAPPVPAGLEAALVFRARLESPRPAGYCPSLRLILNGKHVDGPRLLNKGYAEERVDGSTQSMTGAGRFTVGYAPDFESPDRHPSYAFRRAKVCEFVIRVTDLVREGDNVLVIENAILSGLTNTLVVASLRLEYRPPRGLQVAKAAPAGPLPIIAPRERHLTDYTVQLQDSNDVIVTIAGRPLRVESEFSTPKPKWEKGTNGYFRLERSITRGPEAVIVRDRFTNLSDQELPIMQRHRARLEPTKVWIAGLAPASRTGVQNEPANPTTFAIAGDVGLGLVPLDDVFLVHTENRSDVRSIELADRSLVLQAKAAHTAEWAIVPVARQPDEDWRTGNTAYFSFVNAVRRLRDVNFTIDGGFAFLRADGRNVGKWSDGQIAEFIDYKAPKFLCITICNPMYQGHYPHGTAFQTLDLAEWTAEVTRRRRLRPTVKNIAYFHCFIDVLDGAEKKYADARLLHPDGTAADYGEPHDRLFVPTETNAFGRDVARNVERIFEIGCDGVYWDEMEFSRYPYHYGLPWDGVSADIEPHKLTIIRKKSSVALLTQAWRIGLARKILARGPLVANSQPHTRSMAALQFPRFVETGSISHCTNAQLYSPIALGDHLTERSEVDAYRVMLEALRYGCIYYWYDDLTVVPTHGHLSSYMFPITPVELREGCIIGKERIVTATSGRFGWNDDSGHEVHVFDEQGRPSADFPAPRHVEGSRAYTDLRLPAGYSAAIIRRPRRP